MTYLGFGPNTVEFARAAEDAGFEAVAFGDHVFFPEEIHGSFPGSSSGKVHWAGETQWPDIWVTVGALSAVTTRLRFMSSVYILPLRHPFVVAQAVGTAAVLSGGRVIFGAGIGWNPDEFAVMDQDFSNRGGRAEEMLEVLRLLWTGQVVEHHGRRYDFGRLQMSLRVPSRIPIYLGGRSDIALDRAARVADGYISGKYAPEQFDDLQALIGRLDAKRVEHGRADQPFEVVAIVPTSFDLDVYRQLAGIGVTTAVVGAGATPDAASWDSTRDIARFGDEVIVPSRNAIERRG